MSEFELIHDELVSLGWIPESGRGDHIKFTRSGNRQPITISRSISSGGRSYLNALSNIRKQEPRFSLGKTAKAMEKRESSEKRQKRQPCLTDLSPADRMSVTPFLFIREGEPVRYSSPENFDYSKLTDGGSVMNIRYTVRAIAEGDVPGFVAGEDRIRISDDDEIHVMDVLARDLDAWELKTCPECGRALPVNRFHLFDEPELQPICEECFVSAKKRVSEAMKNISADIDVKKAVANIKDTGSFSSELQCELKKYGNVPIMYMPKELRERVMAETAAIREKMNFSPSQKKRFDKVMQSVGVTDAPSKTPYECWTAWLRTVKFTVERAGKDNKVPRKETDAIVKAVYNSSYTIDKLGELDVINIIPGGAYAVAALMAAVQGLYLAFDDIYPDKNYCARIRYPKGNIDQYVSCIGKHRGIMDALRRELTPEDFEEHCAVVRMLSGLRTYDELTEGGKGILCGLIAKGLVSEEDAASVSVNGVLTKRLYKSLPDGREVNCLDVFAMVPRLEFNVNDIEEPELFTRIARDDVKAEILSQVKKIFDDETEVAVVPISRREVMNKDITDQFLLEPRREYEHTYEKDIRIRLPFELWTALYRTWGDLDEAAFRRKIVSVLEECCHREGDGKDASMQNPALAEPSMSTPKINIDMSEYSSLDSKNPASENEVFRDVTTRDLLRELKGRGVQFEGLSVPVVVRQSVSLDEI